MTTRCILVLGTDTACFMEGMERVNEIGSSDRKYTGNRKCNIDGKLSCCSAMPKYAIN